MNEKQLSIDNSVLVNYSGSMGMNSRPKFENIQKLSAIMKGMQQNNKSIEPQQILEEIKKKIADNYNNLYDNYEINKQEIIRNIQKTQTNHSNQNFVQIKFDNVVKEKNFYDKLKVQIEIKQKKLKIIQNLKNQLKSTSQPGKLCKVILENHMKTVQKLENQRDILSYEAAVLVEMKKMRGNVKLTLKQRHQNMLNQQKVKKQKIAKMKDVIHMKKTIINRIKETISAEEIEKMPMPLTEALDKKLQQYEGRYTQQNIIIHQNKMSKLKEMIQKQLQDSENAKLSNIKQAKYKQDKRQYNIMYNHYVIKKSQEQKIKKLCRVETIIDVADGSLSNERSNLQGIQQEISNQIEHLNRENEEIKKELEEIMTTISNEQNNENYQLLQIQQQLQEEESQLKKLKSYLNKKQQLMNKWQSSFLIIFNTKCFQHASNKIQQSIRKYQDYCNREKVGLLEINSQSQQKRSVNCQLHKKQFKPIGFQQYISTSIAGSEYTDF